MKDEKSQREGHPKVEGNKVWGACDVLQVRSTQYGIVGLKIGPWLCHPGTNPTREATGGSQVPGSTGPGADGAIDQEGF